MLKRAFQEDAALLPVLVLFEDTVGRRPPVFRPLGKAVTDVPTARQIDLYVNGILEAKTA